MIETTIPEINVSELMERVRVKMAEPQRAQVRPQLPRFEMIRQFAATILPKPVTPKTEKILRATQAAREATTISRWIPKPLRGLFRRQDKFNREVLRAIESLNNSNAQLVDRLRHLIACIEVQDHGMQHLAELRRVDGERMDEVAVIQDNHAAWMQGAERLLSSLTDHRRKVLSTTRALEERITGVEQHNLAAVEAVELVGREAQDLRQQLSRLDALNQESRELRDAQHNSFAELICGLRNDFGQVTAVRNDLESLEQRHTSDSAFIKAELSRQSALVYKLVAGVGAGSPGKGKRAADGTLSEMAAHRLDAFYFSFENRFRGPREEIKKRMRFYLPLLESCGAGKQGRPIVDLGCGRGEWLELLREQNLKSTGIDLNKAMIDQCTERRLNVVQADAIEFLRELPDASHGAITGFHIIEHLSLDTLVTLIAETFRVLHPGGIAIFESPNCKNLTVGASSFFIDPTHRNPVFPETAQFMLETTGFDRVTLEYLCPVEPTEIADIEEYPTHLRQLLYGPRDFGVIGYKPAGQELKRDVKSQ